MQRAMSYLQSAGNLVVSTIPTIKSARKRSEIADKANTLFEEFSLVMRNVERHRIADVPAALSVYTDMRAMAKTIKRFASAVRPSTGMSYKDAVSTLNKIAASAKDALDTIATLSADAAAVAQTVDKQYGTHDLDVDPAILAKGWDYVLEATIKLASKLAREALLRQKATGGKVPDITPKISSWLSTLCAAASNANLELLTKPSSMHTYQIRTLMSVLPPMSAMRLKTLANAEILRRRSDTQRNRDITDTVIAKTAIRELDQLKAKYAPRMHIPTLRVHGIGQCVVPLRVETTRRMDIDTLAKNGLIAKPFSFEKHVNNNLLVMDQTLLCFRRSDADAYNKDRNNSAKRNDASIIQQRNLRKAKKQAEQELAELEAATVPKTQPAARAKHLKALADVKKRLADIEASFAQVDANAVNARKLANTFLKKSRSDSDAACLPYAESLLDMINTKYGSNPYSLVSGNFLHKAVNPDYVWAWVMPRSHLRALLSLTGDGGRFIKNWQLPW